MTTPADILLNLETRLRQAMIDIPRRRPWVEPEREQILAIARESLGFREEWVPTVQAERVGEQVRDGVRVELLRATTWPGCRSAAHLFQPDAPAAGTRPLVLLFCGHGKGGKRAEGYQKMAWRLARMGCAVLVPDNIGQGERTPMGHRDVLGPFQCGISLQGLIVMEAAAWLAWAQADARFDRGRFAAIGNSGGGLLTLFLGALRRDDFAAISSSAYPSSFEWVAFKEKDHCHCNLIPGIVGQIEMWQLYGIFAPKPLYLFQGIADILFPEDVFETTCRKTADAYAEQNGADAFKMTVFPGPHPWDTPRRDAMAEWLGGVFGLDGRAPVGPEPDGASPECYDAWPADALDADAVARLITGRDPAPVQALQEIYAPDLADVPDVAYRRVTFHQQAAQWRCFLPPERRGSGPR